jgi:hypothetical protein
VEHSRETQHKPPTNSGKVVSGCEGLYGERCLTALGSVQPGDELARGSSRGRESRGLVLDFVGVQEGHSWVKQRNELPSNVVLPAPLGPAIRTAIGAVITSETQDPAKGGSVP